MSKHEFAPFEHLLERVRDEQIPKWSAVEEEFIHAVEKFDTEYALGSRKSGWYQAKARYFNDVIVDLLSNMSNKAILSRCKKASQLFRKIDIDICFPGEGDPIVAGEVKALGTPPHPRNKNTARRGSNDLHKRVREVGFTSTDLKAAYASPQSIRSFQEWIDTTSPGYFSFWAVRVDDSTDLESVRGMLTSMRAYCNGIGAVIYQPTSPSTATSYRAHDVAGLSIDFALREMAQRIA
jgi:hypothetical protein